MTENTTPAAIYRIGYSNTGMAHAAKPFRRTNIAACQSVSSTSMRSRNGLGRVEEVAVLPEGVKLCKRCFG